MAAGQACGCTHEQCNGASLTTYQLPKEWPVPPEGVVLSLAHHVDIIVPDDRNKEELKYLDDRVTIHATTPVFHPNIGEPEDQYCLGHPDEGWKVEHFLDQFLAIAGWHKDVINLGDIRNPDASEYFKLLRDGRWPLETLPERSASVYSGGDQWRVGG